MIEVNPHDIAPSQDFLKERTVRFILECFATGNLDELPPNPIVRRDEQGRLVAIDGHNLLAIRAYRGEQQSVHAAESATDGLPADSEANVTRNQDLTDKFESCLAERDRVAGAGIGSFGDLIAKYPDLFETNNE